MARNSEVDRHTGAEVEKTTVFDFISQVRAEMYKITWARRKETMVTTAMVFVMVAIISVYFIIIDRIIKFGVGSLLGFGG